jgi:hypothetical protein
MQQNMRSQVDSEDGQATVEFCMTLIMLFGFVLFYIQLSLVFAFGNYAHYATFMSARAYLSSGPDQEDQKERARSVITRMLKRSEALAGEDKFPFIAKGIGGGSPAGFMVDAPDQYNADDKNFSWLEGVRYTFRSRVMMIPFAGRSSKGDSVNSVTFTSESWLGREPTYIECQSDIKNRNQGIFDNGC